MLNSFKSCSTSFTKIYKMLTLESIESLQQYRFDIFVYKVNKNQKTVSHSKIQSYRKHNKTFSYQK